VECRGSEQQGDDSHTFSGHFERSFTMASAIA
jgi:hypothetical protein